MIYKGFEIPSCSCGLEEGMLTRWQKAKYAAHQHDPDCDARLDMEQIEDSQMADGDSITFIIGD